MYIITRLKLNREEQKYLEPYFKSKKIRIRNDLNDNSEELLKKALADEDMSDSEMDEPSDSDEGDRPVGGGGEDEDSEDDEDFQEDSDDDDVAEEYDENAKGSDSGSDKGSDDIGEADEEKEERPAK